MLPFLKLKKSNAAGIIMKNRTPDESKDKQEDKEPSSIKDHVKSLMSAIKSDNHDEAESCIREIFKALDKEPHEEGPHGSAEPHSYASQNEEAAD